MLSFLVLGALTAYQGIVSYSVSPSAQIQLNDFRKELTVLATVKSLSCFDKIQTVLGLQPWVANSVSQNLNAPKNACFESKVNDCHKPECSSQLPSNEAGTGKAYD